MGYLDLKADPDTLVAAISFYTAIVKRYICASVIQVEPGTGANFVVYNEQAFEKMFKEHFKALHCYAAVMLKDEDMAEEIVQNMFLKLWEKRDRIYIQGSVKAYLYKCVYNDSLNHLKHLKVKANYESHAGYEMNDQSNEPVKTIELKELEGRLRNALADLPEQCLTVFQMSRFEELKYREIADRLGVSVKAVEKQMGKALRILRVKLVDFLPVILLWLINRIR